MGENLWTSAARKTTRTLRSMRLVAVRPRTWYDGYSLRVGMRVWVALPLSHWSALSCAGLPGAAQAQGTGLHGDRRRAALVCSVPQRRWLVPSLLPSSQPQRASPIGTAVDVDVSSRTRMFEETPNKLGEAESHQQARESRV